MGDRADVHTIGSKVWVSDDADSWIKGEVVKVAEDRLVVRTEKNEERTLTAEQCPLQNQDARGVEDMTRLSYLHEPGVLWNLKVRYGVDDIYTYTGSILIAVNPFAALPHMYGPHMMDQYCGVNLGELSPHVYAIADAAYRQMRKEGKGQSILVSGESGAGKTETSKLIMKYLAYMGGFVGKSPQRAGRSVEEQVLESNPLLEAFGNAKTVRNNNSSRFGKYVEINFSKDGYITGAAIRTYLLERSRVVAINSPERSYHIFYQLCDGATPEERQKWFLKPAKDFDYLKQSDCFEIPGVSNAEEYQHTIRAMSRVGIPPEDQESIFRTVAAILHLGNVKFVDDGDVDSSKVAPGPGDDHLTACAELLGVDKAGLAKGLTTQTRQTPEGPIVSPISVQAAVNNRDSLAKVIYAKMFDWLVHRVNMAIGEDKNCAASVGVLDIYGFESFQFNDLEQFCINLANEKLQQHFNQHVFKMEQAEYEREEIDWSYIEFVDNQDVLDLIEGRMGILDLLDELCRFPRATPNDFAQKLYGSQLCKGSRRFTKPKLSQSSFIVDHYAGAVTYQCDNFLEKNKDFVVAEHQVLLQNSVHAFVRDIFPEEAPPPPSASGPARSKTGGTKFNSVGTQFKKQLAELMAQLYQMEPHYVRCIKPNEKNKPGMFQNTMVLQQLRCGGVLEAVRINCAGFPSKRTYSDFVDHFWPLCPDVLHSDMDDKDISAKLLSLTPLTGYQLGKTKVFLRAGQMALMDKLRTDKMNKAASVVQRFAKGMLARIYKRRLVGHVCVFQAGVRAWQARMQFRFLRETKAATLIQTAFRRHKTVMEYKSKHATIIRLQALYRGQRTRKAYQALRRERATLCIQKNWRRYVARNAFVQERAAATLVQNMFRGKRARQSLRFLKSQAREATKLLEDKKMLEIKVKELQATLDVVQGQRNELRQQVKDNLAALTEAHNKIKELEDEMSTQVDAIKAQTSAELAAEHSQKDALATEINNLKAALTEVRTTSERTRIDLQKELNVAQEYIGRLQLEKSESNKQFQSMKEELITRLTNACAQRDEAREQVLNLNQLLEESKTNESRLAEQLTQKDAEMQTAVAKAAAAAKLAQAATAATTPPPATHTSPSPTVMSPQPTQIPSAPTPAAAAPAPAAAAPAPAPASPPAHRSAVTDFSNMAISANVANIMRSRAASLRPNWLSSNHDAAGSPSLPPTGLPPRTPTMGGRAASSELDDGLRTPVQETETDRRAREIQAKQQQLVADRRRQDEERLLNALSSNMGFNKGRPIAALAIFRSCIQWRSFQADRTSVFDKIIQVIGSQIEKQQDNNSCLAYWLTNTVTLLHLLQKNIKPASNASTGRGQRTLTAVGSRSILGQLFRTSTVNNAEASIHGGGVGGFRQVEAKYPALLFKQQLDAFVQKIFPMMRDNVKKMITPMLAGCIHTPKGTRTAPRGRGGADASQPQAVVNKHWREILDLFDELLRTVKDNHVPKVLVQALFRQLFSFVNVQLFNQLLLRRECCSFSNGEYVKTGLALVESWITEEGKDHVGDSLEELKYIRQAVQFLVLANKPKKSLEDITRDLCPVLSIQQLYRISTMFWDDKYNTETVSPEVLQKMKQSMVDSNSSASHSFLLDDDSTLPFAAQDVLAQMDDKDLYVGLPVPDSLKDGESAGNFSFLEKELRLSSQHSQS